MSSKLTYALLENELVFISDPRVKNGFQCACICPECKKPLNARNNEKNVREKHFAHKPGDDCPYAVESALHLLAKSVLSKNKKIFVPDFHYDYRQKNLDSKFKDGQLINLETVILEKTIIEDGVEVIPDAIGIINDKEVFIEFAKTHFVDETKLQKIIKLNKTCIEIKINHLELDEIVLSNFLTTKSPFIYWINNPRLNEEFKKKEEDERRRKEQEEKEWKEEIEKQTKENNQIKEKYKYNTNFKKYKLDFIYSRNCPLVKMEVFQNLDSRYLELPIIKDIINGSFWNTEIYGRIPNGKYIFLGKEKKIVFPPDKERENMTAQQERLAKSIYGGLKEIERIRYKSKEGVCEKCNYKVAIYNDEQGKYSVCNYKPK